ncbi:MAG: acyl-CoA synthetase [Candidatus Carbobacillus altaicus]|nr:acyl-CoA synthetase [Candidatus Carbobacillus altaicus]
MSEFYENLIAPDMYNMADDLLKAPSDRLALIWENEAGDERTVTYGELSGMVGRLGNVLKDIGLKKGERVMVMMPRLPETYAIYMSLLKSGLVILPGSELLMPGDIEYRLNHAEVRAVIAHHTFTSRFDEAFKQSPTVQYRLAVGGDVPGWLSYDALTQEADEAFSGEQTSRDDLAFLSYTSGTTGYPKGVMHTHGWGYAHFRIAAERWLGSEPLSRVWATL